MRILVAGATGAVGSVLVPELRRSGVEVTPHVRPKTAATHPLGKDPEALVCDLGETAPLDREMARCDGIVCLVGTMRRRFAAGDTYESSDYQPVVQLLASANRVPFSRRRHFVLLSALGARPGAGYLGWKFRAEQVVRRDRIPWTVVRPSFLDTRGTASQPSDGTRRTPPPTLDAVFRFLGRVPGLAQFADDFRPMGVDVLCRALARIVRDRAPHGVVLTGRALWPLAADA
jgi:uncharacterized protein YbjT (DUF2867 family)